MGIDIDKQIKITDSIIIHIQFGSRETERVGVLDRLSLRSQVTERGLRWLGHFEGLINCFEMKDF